MRSLIAPSSGQLFASGHNVPYEDVGVQGYQLRIWGARVGGWTPREAVCPMYGGEGASGHYENSRDIIKLSGEGGLSEGGRAVHGRDAAWSLLNGTSGLRQPGADRSMAASWRHGAGTE